MKEKTIDGVRFAVAPFRAVEALRLKPYLIKKFGPSVGQLLGVLRDGLPDTGKIGDIRLDGEVFSHAVEKLMEQLGEDDFISLIKRLFANVTAYVQKEGQTLELHFTESTFDNSLDVVFAGKLFSIYPVMLFVLEVNFPDFFGKVTQGIGSRIQKIATSELPKASSTSASPKSETSES